MSKYDPSAEGAFNDPRHSGPSSNQVEMSQSQWASMRSGGVGSSAGRDIHDDFRGVGSSAGRDIHDDFRGADTGKVISAVERAADEIDMRRIDHDLDKEGRNKDADGMIDCGFGDIYARHCGSGAIGGALDGSFAGSVGRGIAKAKDAFGGLSDASTGDEICTAWKLPADENWEKR